MASTTREPKRPFQGLFLTIGVAGLALLLISCQALVPRQGWSKKWGPLVPHKTFPGDCSLCHVPENWHTLKKDFTFDHEKETGHALGAAHARAACLRCHNDRGPVQAYAARGCGGCHVDPHQGTLGLTCTACHQEQSWRPVGLVAEHSRTRFPLAGAHAVTPCESCHVRAPVGEFVGAPTRCEDCHQRDLARATSPDHLASGWVTGCERCHSQAGWSSAQFDHRFFPLTGGHSGLDCFGCHSSGTPGPIPSDCYSCHQDDYQRAANHVAMSYPRDCAQCHNTTGWSGAPLNHRFPIDGPHNLSCANCHPGGDSRTFTCLTCHQHDQATMDEKHKEVTGYSYSSPSCYRCHPNGRH